MKAEEYLAKNSINLPIKNGAITLVSMEDAFKSLEMCKNERVGVEEVNGEDYGIDSLWNAQRILEKTLGKVEGYQTDDGILEHKAAITAVKKLREQKHALTPIFEVGDVMRTKEEATKGWKDGMPVIVSIDDEYYRCNNEIIDIKDQYQYEYPPMNKQKSAEWSEEDKRMIDTIISDLERHGGKENSCYSTEIDWLKSLRPHNQK